VYVKRVVGVLLLVDGMEEMSCAKEEVGRVQERNRRVEESDIAD
jgi:hypothetical protein